jgi:hypothetical protein
VNSKDLSLIILLSAIHSILVIVIGQMEAYSGIIGLGFLLTIIHALFISIGFFSFQGRRWRFFYYNSLRALLASIIFFFGGSTDLLFRILAIIIIGFVADLIFNSVYEFFNRKNIVLWWGILATLITTSSIPLGTALVLILFTPSAAQTLIKVYLLLYPVIIIESIAGANIGFRIYQRTRKLISKSELDNN